jgi:hypothetical protein
MNKSIEDEGPIATVQGVDMDQDDHQTLDQIRQDLNGLSSSIDTFLVRGFLAPETPAADGSGMPSW